jgi:hypothetical protein
MITFYIVTVLFALAMVANIVVLVRHWRMMRLMDFTLKNLIETQKEFDELIERDLGKK